MKPTGEQIAGVIADILIEEGGYVDDPNDPGGATNFGITQATADEFNLGPVKELTAQRATQFYAGYFTSLCIDQIPDPHVFALVADAVVNHGPGLGIGWLQTAVHAVSDGVLGPKSLAALNAVTEWQAIYADVLSQRINFYGHIISVRPGNAEFAKGWLRRATTFLNPWPQW